MSTLKSILNEELIIEAIKINSGKEAYSLIRNNKIGAKVDPSYKFNDDDTDKSDSLIISLGKLIKSVGANNAPFAVQLAVNKIPMEQLESVVNNNSLKEIISYKNKPWAKEIPGYQEIIQLNNKKINEAELSKVLDNLQKESIKHGKANKGSGNLKDVKTLYNDGAWSLQIPTSFEGAKAASYYKKDGEFVPTHWCTRADKRYYDMYSENSPLYIIRNDKDGKAYQVAFDKLNVHFLDQDDTDGDEATKGDLSKIPDNLLKLIKWNGRTLLDFKKEYSRTEMHKGELKNPTSDFKDAEWEPPKNEGDGIVSQVMKNLYNKENGNNFTTFMVKGKPFKFNKRNNYAKKYYYKNKPNLIVISVLSKNGDIRDDINWPFKIDNGNLVSVNTDEFIKLVGDRGALLAKASEEKLGADNKRRSRANAKKSNYNFESSMADLLADTIEKQYIESGLIGRDNHIEIETVTRSKNFGNGSENFGNFIPIGFTIDISAPGISSVVRIEFEMDNRKCLIKKVEGYNTREVTSQKNIVENATNEALKKYYKKAIHNEYGRRKRAEYRAKSKGAVVYDTDRGRKLQFEEFSYFKY